MRRVVAFITIIVVFLIGSYFFWNKFFYRDLLQPQVKNGQSQYTLYFTEPKSKNDIWVIGYEVSSRKWNKVLSFPGNLIALDTGDGFIVTNYFGDAGNTEYYSYDGKLKKTYWDYKILQYQHKGDINAFLAQTSNYGRLQMFIEKSGQIFQWGPENLDIPDDKNFSWIDIIDNNNIFYSFSGETGDSQRELNLAKIDIISGRVTSLVSYPAAENPSYLGYDDSMKEIYISKNLGGSGFVIFSYNIRSRKIQEFYHNKNSYLVGSLPLYNDKVIFSEQEIFSDHHQKLQLLDFSKGLVSTVISGDYLPKKWIDDSLILALKDGQSLVLDVTAGKVLNIGDEFKTHNTLYPLLEKL